MKIALTDEEKKFKRRVAEFTCMRNNVRHNCRVNRELGISEEHVISCCEVFEFDKDTLEDLSSWKDYALRENPYLQQRL